MNGLTFDGEASYNVPDLRHDDDAYMTCEHCGKAAYMGDRHCSHCGNLPVHTFAPFQRSRLAGTLHRPCETPGCRVVSLDGDDDE